MIEILVTHPYFLFAAMLGGAVASFSCVVVERAGSGEGLGGRSHCVCGTQLAPWVNLPVIGWVAAGGRAHCCGASIPSWYLVAELIGVLTWAIAGWFGLPYIAGVAIITLFITIIYRNLRIRRG
jgi:prepilin signal peptidase PulO-like enzyme (type II secretory pathway)